MDYSLRFSLVARCVLWLVPVSRGGRAWLAKGGPVNNLQLFRMYDRFKDQESLADYDYRPGNNDLWANWQKWHGLAERTAAELEKRLVPPADDSLQRRNDAVRFCARLGLFTPDGRIEYR